MACMASLTFIANFCLTGVKWLESFFPQFIQQADRRNVGIAFASGSMFFLRKNAGNKRGQLVVGQWAIFTDNICVAET
uniref:Sea43 n=1 Tax=Serratia entomophila TaxID=42906 RepID=A7M7G8_9GAMM|nr:Sea43 [Serratia entomophila]